jgi:predicted dehydrogenase
MKKLKFGIVGLGRVSSKTHIPVLKSLENVEIIAGAEKNPQRAERIKNLFDIHSVYDDYEKMYNSENLDAIYVCLPTFLHKDACIKALEKGIHVLCEKPMGMSVDEAEEITALAQKKGCILLPGYKIRYSEIFAQAKKLIDEGILGDILHVQGILVTPGPYISWDPKSDWYLDEQNHGVIYDTGGHLINLLFYLLPYKITNAKSIHKEWFKGYKTPTNITCIFEMENGIIGDLNVGWRGSTDILTIALHGTAGSLTITRDEITYINPGTDPADRIMMYFNNILKTNYTLLKKITDKIRGKNFSREDLTQANTFCNAILTSTKPSMSGEDAVLTHQFLELLIEK